MYLNKSKVDVKVIYILIKSLVVVEKKFLKQKFADLFFDNLFPTITFLKCSIHNNT